ncbi:MAG: radical SAM protein [Eubacteriales bacterium]|nr:radical SAM protein [Eubacteriales bacterium]
MNVQYQLPGLNTYLYQKADRLQIPIGGTFELTPMCNMNCRMCYVRKTREEMGRDLLPAGEWIRIGREAREQGLLFLLLTGGEPFLRPDFREIYEELHDMGFVLTINSNGTLIDEQVISWLKERPPIRINITLYGASNASYARLCANPQGFDQVMRGIHLLKREGIEVKLNYTVTPYNAEDFHAIRKIAAEEELYIQTVTYLFPPIRKGRENIGRNDRFTPETAAYYSAWNQLYNMGPKAFRKRTDTMLAEDSCLDFTTETTEEREGIRCHAGKSSFWVTWEGKMLSCGMLDQPSADIIETGFAGAWKTIVQRTAAIRMPAKCTSCASRKKCGVCAAMVLAESGDYEKEPLYRCRMTECYTDACRQVLEEMEEGKSGYTGTME